jgi:hypothetical protein
MKFFARRRLVNSAATLAALATTWWWAQRQEAALRPSSFFVGWMLLGVIAFLAAFNLRKKVPAPPLGSGAAWMQAHIYAGLASAGLYAMHTSLRWPSGVLDTALAGLYVATFVSGLIGLYWTRTLPKRLSRVGQEVVYERIPALRGVYRDRAQTTVLQTVRSGGTTTLGEFYKARLHDYFSRRRGWRYRLWPDSALRKSLLAELTEATRYLSDAERRTAEDLFSLVRSRDDLDYQEALVWRLRTWLFVHIGLTYPLLAAAGLHAWIAHVFYGGAP